MIGHTSGHSGRGAKEGAGVVKGSLNQANAAQIVRVPADILEQTLQEAAPVGGPVPVNSHPPAVRVPVYADGPMVAIPDEAVLLKSGG